eukprot:m.345848 g.345848  ORF g.345848 m.345848 type:complete len:95 (+) comp27449_c0_seq1:75-359(+)
MALNMFCCCYEMGCKPHQMQTSTWRPLTCLVTCTKWAAMRTSARNNPCSSPNATVILLWVMLTFAVVSNTLQTSSNNSSSSYSCCVLFRSEHSC